MKENRISVLLISIFFLSLTVPSCAFAKSATNDHLARLKQQAITAFNDRHYEKAQRLFDRYCCTYEGDADELKADMETVVADLQHQPSTDTAELRALKRLLRSWLGMEFNPEFRGSDRKQT
jgi:hypothetical protein